MALGPGGKRSYMEHIPFHLPPGEPYVAPSQTLEKAWVWKITPILLYSALKSSTEGHQVMTVTLMSCACLKVNGQELVPDFFYVKRK